MNDKLETKKEKKEKKEKKRKQETLEESPKKKRKSDVEKEEVVIVKDLHVDQYLPNAIVDNIPSELDLNGFNFSESTLKCLQERGLKQLFPIQAAAFRPVMEGKDLLARARTGTGKTLAFSLPIVESLKIRSRNGKKAKNPRALILAPTRELAIQVHKELTQICDGALGTTCIYGGTMYDDQYYALKNGVDIVIGTPGRVIDHVERGNLVLSGLEFVCLDEADQMLDIGFAQDMEKILKLVRDQKSTHKDAPDHQVLLFSATMPDWIKQAVGKYMKPDKTVLDLIGTDKQKTSTTVKHYSLPSRYQNRANILGDIVAVYGRGSNGRTIIFVETKGEANELAMNEKLVAMGAQVLHGDITQKQRETTMQGFRDGKFTCLITTNVCARGVDIPEVDLVVNCEPPSDVESYIHRSGRTGRAGRSGVCITFYKQAQEYLVINISKRAGVNFTKIGAPQPKDIIKARAAQTLDELFKVNHEVFGYFSDSASKLLAHFDNDSQKALECAMALICNTTNPLPSRSLLTANEGFITLLFSCEQTIRNVGYIKSIFQKKFPGISFTDAVGWRCTADYKGVVVDVIESKVKINGGSITLDGIPWTDGRGIKASVPVDLPELQTNSRPGMNTGRTTGRFPSRGRGRVRGRS